MILPDKSKEAIFDVFDGFDRFAYPGGIVRVTSGYGGEAILILGSEKTALLDCGMAYCGRFTVSNIKEVLDQMECISDRPRSVDMVLVSHTHYDHIGALPRVLEQWPEAVVVGSAKAKSVFKRPGALRLMKLLGEHAGEDYMPEGGDPVSVDGLRIDKVVGDGDVISMGDEQIVVLETKGHTDCSLTFVLEPAGVMFASESTGVLERLDFIHTPVLKSYGDTVKSLRKCREYGAKYVVNPHYGLLPEFYIERYWDKFASCLNEKLDFVDDLCRRKLTDAEMLSIYTDNYWSTEREIEQPIEAFITNAKCIIKALKNRHNGNE